MDTLFHLSHFLKIKEAYQAYRKRKGIAARSKEEWFRGKNGKGAWYNVKLVVREDGEFRIEYDYDNKPKFEMEVDDSEYVLDNEEFPRDKESTPDWLNDILLKN